MGPGLLHSQLLPTFHLSVRSPRSARGEREERGGNICSLLVVNFSQNMLPHFVSFKREMATQQELDQLGCLSKGEWMRDQHTRVFVMVSAKTHFLACTCGGIIFSSRTGTGRWSSTV